MNLKTKIIAATPMICLIVFLLLGFCFGLWHPGWLVFLLIPIVSVFLGTEKIIVTYPMVCAFIYLLLGVLFGLWHPGWIIFLTIPVVSIFTTKGCSTIEDEIIEEDDEE